MRRSSRLRWIGLALGAAALAAIVASSALAAGHGRDRHVLPGTNPSWTAAAPKTADLPAAQQVSAKVWLAPRNAAQLAALARAVSDPSSSQYQQFISQGTYARQFAPTSAQVDQVSSWLKSAGVQVVSVGADNHYLAVQGSASAIQSAFGAPLARYVVNGKQVQAPAADLSVPDDLAGTVLAVTGLDTLNHMVKPADLGAPAGFVNATPCSQYYGQQQASNLPKFNGQTLPYAVCGYVPSQLRGAYGVDRAGLAGNGQTVAITDAFDASTLRQDADTYARLHGDRPFHGQQFQDRSVPENTGPDPNNPGSTVPESCGGNGWYGEQTLDVEAVHGMAPSANVLYYGAASCYDDDLLAQLAQIVHDNDASIVSNSWGEPTFVVIGGQLFITITQSLVDAYESVFQQGAAQGIGFYFSSGDNGDELAAWGFAHPDFPTGDPWVTSVGGTSLAIGRHNERLFETGWGTVKYSLSGNAWSQVGFLYGAGGGYSQIFDRPWYQNGVVPSNTTGRAVPDIAMDADPTTGMLVGETQTFALPSRFGPAGVHYGEYRIGGTSLASPLLAGVQAVVQSGLHLRIGFANPWIYGIARAVGSNGVFYDVTPQGDAGNIRSDYVNGYNADGGLVYSVRTFDQDSSLTTGPGWDDVTGVGSVNFDFLSGHGRHRR